MITLESLKLSMENCQQSPGISVYKHGLLVREAYLRLVEGGKTGNYPEGWRIPEWIDNLIPYLMDDEIIEKYQIYHDCGKPYCLTIDENRKRHFPNHANVSANIASQISELQEAENLIRMDMDIHLLKSDNIEEFAQREEWATLILTGLAEVHANAEMFGGLNSDSFKIKAKHIAKRGKQILSLHENKYS